MSRISLPRLVARSGTTRILFSPRAASTSAGPSSAPSSRAASSVPGWKPLLSSGRLPAYDSALAFLASDAAALRERLPTLEGKERERAEIESEINDPGLRELVKRGHGDMSKAVVRVLTEQKWRNGGTLGMLMESVHRARVFPDVLPGMEPSVDLQVHAKGLPRKWQDKPAYWRTLTPGQPLPVERVLEAPRFSAQVFHSEERLYTLMIVDPDVPDPTNESFTTYCHMLIPNIALSATGPAISPCSDTSINVPTREMELKLEAPPPTKVKKASKPASASEPRPRPVIEVTTSDWSANGSMPYVPPHPARGSSAHRYVALLISQPGKIGSSSTAGYERKGFSVRRWLEGPGQGGQAVGAGLWTSVWTEEEAWMISEIHRQRNVPEPRYGLPPKEDTGVRRRKPLSKLPLDDRRSHLRIDWESPDQVHLPAYLVTREDLRKAAAAAAAAAVKAES